MKNSKVEWTKHTFNPWRGCTKVSAGCANCYAEALSVRNPGVLGVWGDGGTRVIASESYWKAPETWNRAAAKARERHRVFCASLADVFEDRPELVAPRARLFALIERTPNLDWLLLTKRPENVMQMGRVHLPVLDGFVTTLGYFEAHGFPANVWIGTSVENQEAAEARIPHLLAIPARVRFLSCEPLLGPVDLRKVPALKAAGKDPLIHWVIAGGESGPKARPMHPYWASSLRDQCVAAGVPFFFKQWGEWAPGSDFQPGAKIMLDDGRMMSDPEWQIEARTYSNPGLMLPTYMRKVGKKTAGRLLDGREWNEFPEENPDAR